MHSVNHIDENKENNNANNLEWCTVLYNNIYGNRIEKAKQKQQKRIIQFDLKGNFVKEYISLTSAAKENNIPIGNISACINNKYKQSHGYIWRLKGVV